MKKQIIMTASLLIATQAFAQQAPATSASAPVVSTYYSKQVQGMSLDNLSPKDREKFQQGYDNFTNSAKMTPVPKIQLPSKEEINKQLNQAGNK